MERKHTKLPTHEIMTCYCKEPRELTSGSYTGLYTIGCGRRCLNRVMSIECSAAMCQAGERCTNRRFQLQQHLQLYPVKTDGRG